MLTFEFVKRGCIACIVLTGFVQICSSKINMGDNAVSITSYTNFAFSLSFSACGTGTSWVVLF
jgi:hypothetical protein